MLFINLNLHNYKTQISELFWAIWMQFEPKFLLSCFQEPDIDIYFDPVKSIPHSTDSLCEL
jgi:hypothetical protein